MDACGSLFFAADWCRSLLDGKEESGSAGGLLMVREKDGLQIEKQWVKSEFSV